MEIDAVLEVEAGDPQIAIEFLLANINLSKSRLKDLMSKGGVWRVTKEGERERLRRAMTDIFVGEQLEIFYNEDLLALKPLKPELIIDEGQYSVWNKPAGMPLLGNDFGDFHSFGRAVEYTFNPNRPIFWLSAIDYEATGMVILAHSRKAAADLTTQFNPEGLKGAEVHYRCEVIGDYQGGDRIDLDLEGEPSRSRVEKVRYDARPNRTVLDVWLETGREHQVRKQLAELGYPVIGDEEYGPENDEMEGLRLKIVELKFDCPLNGDIQHVSMLK
jgi:tRNA pseudouridine32 synthase/23S rRNA pseudouridine746 synthase